MSYPQFEQTSWNGTIADDFTVENVRIVANGIAQWMKSQNLSKAFIGYDTRFGGKLFAKEVGKVFLAHGLSTIVSTDAVTSAMLILNVAKSNADIGVMITASSQPADQNGIKLKGVSHQGDIDLINTYIKDAPDVTVIQESINVPTADFMPPYLHYISSNIDVQAIKDAGALVIFDAMYGAAQIPYEKLLPVSMRLGFERNPSFKNEVPNPIPENLTLLSTITKSTPNVICGFATNSDGELLSMCDEEGIFIDPYSIVRGDENVPWRDAIYIALKIIEKMVKSGNKLSELV